MPTANDLVAAIQANDRVAVENILNQEPMLVHARTDTGLSMLLVAQYHGFAEIVQVLLAHNAQVDLYDASAIGETARATGWLAMQPALANSFAPDGFTPLGLAAFFGHLEIVNALLMYHADPNVPSHNTMQVTPLHSAVAGNHYAIAAKLIEAGANVNATQADGFTPLMGAAQSGNLEMVQLLLDHGASVNARVDKQAKEFANMTALGFARQGAFGKIVTLLEAFGAK